MFNTILNPNISNISGLEVIVCMNESDLQEQIIEQLLTVEAKVYLATSPQDAMTKLQFHSFHILLLEEGYSMEIMQFLACMPMVVRRNLFYVILSDACETKNMLQSYILSANLVINKEDIRLFLDVLNEAVLNNNHFFRPLFLTMMK